VIRARPRRRAAALPARVDVYVHFDHDDGPSVPGILSKILQRLGALEAQGVRIMADINEVEGNMEKLGVALAELVREVGVLVAQGPGLVTQERLDALNAKVLGLADLAKGADPNPDA
jgi:hypothetical protein